MIAASCLLLVSAEARSIDLTSFHEKRYSYPIELEVGETLEVKLRENPSTGYKWLVMDEVLAKSGLQDVIV